MGYSMFLAGLSHHDEKHTSPGYTLYTPMSAPAFYLIDMGGNVVHEWVAPTGTKTFYGTLLENGNLLAKLVNGTRFLVSKGGTQGSW